MKKVLSCLCAVVLLLSTLLVGAVPASATDVENPLLADYRTEELFNAAVAAGKLSTGHADRAEVSFNATLGAANITYKNPSGATRADETWIYMDPVNEVAVAGNEVIVAKVKAPAGKNADGFLTYSHRAMAGDKGITYKNTADNNGNHWYTKAGASEVLAGEDGWLYVSYTAKADVDAAGVAADAKWGRVQVIGHGFFYNTNDTLSIAWVGAFESLEAAKAWDEGDSDSTTTATTVTTTVTMAAETTTTSTVAETTTSTVTETTVVSTETTTTTATETTTTTAETTTTTVEETTTTKPALEVSKGDKFYFDFSTEEGYKAMSGWGNYRGQLNNAKGENSFNLDSTRWREASNLAYDAEVGGAKIVKKDDATSPIECVLFKRAEGLDAEYPDEYPVVGIKVKINKKATPGIFGYSAAISSQWQWPWSWSISGYTGEWQLITFTVDDYKSTIDDQSWKGLIGQLVKNPQDFANDEVIGHIAWGGVFASEDDAMNHFINTTPDYVAPEPPVDDGTPFLVDLTTKEKYDSAVENGLIFTNNTDNASLEYNENVGAAMFTYLNGRPISDARRGEAGFCFRA
ncbi:MAG: hypothetical protein IJO59_03690, partial [Clostridia bacterium]|nr:hypothetical protein [Clostridia bacterium]